MSQPTGINGRSSGGRFGAATPGTRPERASINDLVTATDGSRRRRVITPWRITALVVALLVAGGSYALGRYVIAPKPPHLVSLVVSATALPAGAELTAGDLRVVAVKGTRVPAGLLGPQAVASDLGLFTRQPIPAGTFLASSMLSPSGGLPDASQALVGLSLKPGQLPAGGLAIGQKVLVVLLPVNSQGDPLNPISLLSTTVWDLQAQDAQGDEAATVIVPASLASKLTSYAARGEVSLVATAAPPPTTKPPAPKPTTTNSKHLKTKSHHT
jgi:hypothetical protein